MLLHLPALPPVKGHLGLIPDGAEGTRATLRIMARLAREGMPLVRQVALQLTNQLKQKNYKGEIQALFDFVKNHIRYVKDMDGVETVQTPAATLQLKAGDCDDKSTLLAALLKSIGHPARFHAIGFKPGQFQHVYVETRIGEKWLPLETTENWPMGRAATGAKSHIIVHIK